MRTPVSVKSVFEIVGALSGSEKSIRRGSLCKILRHAISKPFEFFDHTTCARCSGCLAKTLLLVSARRCRLASFAALLASSLDFLQGTSEKIHFHGLFCQKLLQAMDFFAVSGCVRARPRRFLSCFNHFQLLAPLVEAPRSYPEFSRQLTDIFASLHPCDGHSLKFPGVSLSLHCGFLSRKLCPILCATSRVHSTSRGTCHITWVVRNPI